MARGRWNGAAVVQMKLPTPPDIFTFQNIKPQSPRYQKASLIRTSVPSESSTLPNQSHISLRDSPSDGGLSGVQIDSDMVGSLHGVVVCSY